MPAEECRSAICNLAIKSPSGYENSRLEPRALPPTTEEVWRVLPPLQ